MSREGTITRRRFLQGTAALTAAAGIDVVGYAASPAGAEDADRSPVLKGFVVADAHFGWKAPAQPTNEAIAAAMRTIMVRFPDLDMFVDTGDAHHGDAGDGDRADWTDTIQGGCGTVPFYYAAGNHEVCSFGSPADPEIRCNRLGSVPCRPYYSFDIKGIHFVSLPELMSESYVSQEALDWLELDLAVNPDRSTIIFAHNSVAGTTLAHDDLGYRRLANSRQVYAFLNRCPNILAWMHGHNHTWEIVRDKGKLYVSNGRIGGFGGSSRGKYGRGHIGGMYFELGPEHVTVRGYSATEDRFFDEIEGYAHLTQRIDVRTSLDCNAKPSFCYGVGGALDGRRIPVYNHNALAEPTQEVLLTGAKDALINEDPDLAVYSQRTLRMCHYKILPGYAVAPRVDDQFDEDRTWEWLNPGVRIYPCEEADSRTLEAPGASRGRRAYYRCVPGRNYRAAVTCDSKKGGPEVHLRLLIHEPEATQVAAIEGPSFKLTGGKQTLKAEFGVPSLSERESVYTNAESDNVYHAMLEIRVDSFTEPVEFHRVELALADAAGPTTDAAVIIDGRRFSRAGELAPGEVARLEFPTRPAARSVVEISAGGNRALTWLVRQTGVVWQVRNAPVTDKGSCLEIGKLRNQFSARQEVVIVPTVPCEGPYVHRMRHVDLARVTPWTRESGKLSVELVELLGPAEVEIVSGWPPSRIEGADVWAYSDGRITARRESPGMVSIHVARPS